MILLRIQTSQSAAHMNPLSLYIHIPWCIRKCPYCDFNSHKSPQNLPETQYVQALINDLKNDLQDFPARPLQSIFIGGGTPSLFSPSAYEMLFHKLQELVPFNHDIEITLEANPGTVEQQRFRHYRALGINRLSLGIQSFNPKHLSALGRIHDDTQSHLAIESARRAGFDNINLDIMHGLPQQTASEGLDDLHKALSYHPEHISWYQLTLEPNTVFYKKPPKLPSEETAYHLEQEGFQLLQKQGYQRYEISAFCKSDKKALHNMNYWYYGDYYGIGAGAHSKLTAHNQQIHRLRKQRQPGDYLSEQKPFLAEKTCIQPPDLIFEFMLNATRLQEPIKKSLFTDRTGLSLERLTGPLTLAEKKGLIEINDSHWQVTPLGRRYTNDLQMLFLP